MKDNTRPGLNDSGMAEEKDDNHDQNAIKNYRSLETGDGKLTIYDEETIGSLEAWVQSDCNISLEEAR